MTPTCAAVVPGRTYGVIPCGVGFNGQMGLLDDAIREHLELKRRRGADAEEVTRQEHEALGPPQRAEFAEAPATDEPAEPAAEVAEPPLEEPIPAEDPPVEERPEPRDEGWLEDVPEPAAPPEQPIELNQPTVGYDPGPPLDPDAPLSPGPPPEGEDVLEETPDFLQETPEHDRLWFEQKPPRDFDLDR